MKSDSEIGAWVDLAQGRPGKAGMGYNAAFFRRAGAAMKLIIQIPCYNEEGTLEALTRRYRDIGRKIKANIDAVLDHGKYIMGPEVGRRYLPYYYLGVALAEQGRCRAALEAWSESARQGKIDRAMSPSMLSVRPVCVSTWLAIWSL